MYIHNFEPVRYLEYQGQVGLEISNLEYLLKLAWFYQ